MKIIKSISAVAIAAGMLVAVAAQAQAPSFFRIGTGSAGGTYFPIGGTIANGISNPPGSRGCEEGGSCGVPGLIAIAQSTNASVHNNAAVQNGQLEAGMTAADTLWQMYHGKEKFDGKPHPKLRIVANLFPEDLHLVIPKDSKMASLKALKGKRVGIGQAGSGTQVAVLQILADLGINRDDITAAELNNTQSAERLADGQLDAYFYTAGWPVAAMVQLASTKGMSLYSFSDAELARINEMIPSYIPSTIPKAAYEGLTADVKTAAVPALLVVSSDLDEALIYNITKAMWNKNTRAMLDSGHAKGKQVRLETALNGITALKVPMHPGAERFYKEAGLFK